MMVVDVALLIAVAVAFNSATSPTTSTRPGSTEAVVTAPVARVVPPKAPAPKRPLVKASPTVAVATTPAPPVEEPPAEAVFYANCTEVRDAGAAPLQRADPGYIADLDADGDGSACE
jgi:hypothetical protein